MPTPLADADIVAIMASSGSGKTYLTEKIIAKDKRLMIWDYQDDYSECTKRVTTLAEVASELQKKSFRISYVPRMASIAEDFNIVNRLVHRIGDLRYVVEELSAVTTAGWSPPTWKEITSRGRKRGLHLIGLSQHPAAVDKDFFANVTRGYCGRIKWLSHAKAMGQILNVRAETLQSLEARKFLTW